MKFCTICGQKLMPASPPRFDAETGEKINDTCPTDDCAHIGRYHIFRGETLWKNARCVKCGAIESVYP